MTPGAQIAASIELLEAVYSQWAQGRSAPADAVMGDYFKQRRFIGAKDKGFISRRLYAALRHKATLEWYAGQAGLESSPRILILAGIALFEPLPFETVNRYFSGEGYDPDPLYPEEAAMIKAILSHAYDMTGIPEWMRLNVPEWCLEPLKNSLGEGYEAEIEALAQEAPLDLRANSLKTSREETMKALIKEGFSPSPTPYSPWGIRLAKRGAIFNTEAFKNGWFEVQDEGSQMIAFVTGAKPGDKVIDFCAGAGGKTLAVSALMRNKGRVLAWDTSAVRLEQIVKRIRRAGADNIQRHVLTSETDPFIKRHKSSADIVLIDAPCSGSGTWRRNPDLKWRFGPDDLKEITDIQTRILASAARLVKTGGKLVYATCSLFNEENENQINQFLNKNSDFRVATPPEIWNNEYGFNGLGAYSHLRLTPLLNGTDGFYAAVLIKDQ
jgi:16S rRNA (cytosine967-C5)-methyltransferase